MPPVIAIPMAVVHVPVLGVDPVPDYRPLLEETGFIVRLYEETPGWQLRVDDAFRAILDAKDQLTDEMGLPAAEAAVAEATLTTQVKPYARRVLAVASRPAHIPDRD